MGLVLHGQQVSSHRNCVYDRCTSHPTHPATLLWYVETNSNTNAMVFLEGAFYLQSVLFQPGRIAESVVLDF